MSTATHRSATVRPLHVVAFPSWYPSLLNPLLGTFYREQMAAVANSRVKVGVIVPQVHPMRFGLKLLRYPWGPQRELDGMVPTLRYDSPNWFLGRNRLASRSRELLRRTRVLFDQYVAREGRPDVIHAHSVFSGGLAAMTIGRAEGIPFVLTEQSTAFSRGVLSASEIADASAVVESAFVAVAATNAFRDNLVMLLKSPPHRWRTIPNLVHADFFAGPVVQPPARARHFVTVGFLDAKKGYHLLIDAFAMLTERIPDVSLTIVGDGPRRGDLEAQVARSAARGRVRFAGKLGRTQTREVVRQADIFVSSSLFETFGVAIAEALALGVPVIATRCGGPESFLDAEDGWLGPTDDRDYLFSAMLEAAEGAREFSPEAIRQRCKSKFGEAAVTARLISLYREAAQREGTQWESA